MFNKPIFTPFRITRFMKVVDKKHAIEFHKMPFNFNGVSKYNFDSGKDFSVPYITPSNKITTLIRKSFRINIDHCENKYVEIDRNQGFYAVEKKYCIRLVYFPDSNIIYWLLEFIQNPFYIDLMWDIVENVSVHNYVYYPGVVFENSDDAMLFKMIWG